MARRGRRQGAVKHIAHPDTLEHERKVAYATQLRFIHGMGWLDIANTLWPINEDGSPVEGAEKMWESRQAANSAVLSFAKRALKDVQDEAMSAILVRHSNRQAALANAVSQGRTFEIEQSRAEDEFLAKLLGLTTQKIQVAGDPTAPIKSEVNLAGLPTKALEAIVAALAPALDPATQDDHREPQGDVP